MNNKILLTIMIIVALLIAIYKWILSDDTENVEKQETTTEEVQANDTVNETINK